MQEFIEEALRKNGVPVVRPSYYSGRGAREGDLPGRALDAVHAALKAEVSVKAAEQFVQMVADIPVLSATDFLLALEGFEAASWKWDPETPPTRGFFADSMITALATAAEMIAGGHPRGGDDTVRIRSGFLHEHLDELREDQKEKGRAEACQNPYAFPPGYHEFEYRRWR